MSLVGLARLTLLLMALGVPWNGLAALAADDPPQQKAAVAEMLSLMDQAAAAGQFDKAMACARAAYAAAGKTGDPKLVDEVVARGRQVQARQKQAQTVGATAPPPSTEGEAEPGDAAGRAKLADDYWRRAEGQSDAQRKALLDRAAYWYRKALPGLTGLARTKATQRLAVIKSLTQAKADPAGAKPTTGTWRDLIAQAQSERQTLSGVWRVSGQRLEADAAPQGARLTFPVTPTGNYELSLRFVRKEHGTIGIALPVGSRICVLALSYGEASNGLDTIDGRRANANASTVQAALNNARTYHLEISVRIDGPQAAITATLDGRPWIFYRGPITGLAIHDDWKYSARSLGLIVQSAVVFEELKYRE